MTKVRISGISNLGDARAVSALGVDFIGMNLTQGDPNALSPIKVHDYLQWLTGIQVVAQVHHLDIEKSQRFAELLDLNWVEINWPEKQNIDLPKNLWVSCKHEVPTGEKAKYVCLSEPTKLPEPLMDDPSSIFITPTDDISIKDIAEAGYSINLPIEAYKKGEETDWAMLENSLSGYL